MLEKRQTDIFLESEANHWFERNKNHMPRKEKDILFLESSNLFSIDHDGFRGVKILEVGCSNGYRLNWLKNEGACVSGFDPSLDAIADGKSRFNFVGKEIFQDDMLSFFTTNKATKQQSNKATKQQSNKATKQQSNKATKL